ncbi:MAG TPA: thioesterase family protein [Rudaea sp.]|nr:thioesterase family protein [Rudaea sp.]
MSTFTELLSSVRLGAGTAEAEVGEDWLQGRSVFGGLQAAIALLAMRTLVPAGTPLRALQMTFIAPVAHGRVGAHARLLRAGKNVSHVESRLGSEEEVQALVVGIFGAARESIVHRHIDPPAPPRLRRRLAFARGVTPSFMQHFDVDLLDGALPFANAQISRAAFEVGLHGEGPATEAHLLAIADFVPPVALSWMPQPVPGSSLTWMLEILDADFATQPLAGWRMDPEMVAASAGYTSQSTTLWAPDGRAIALSRQTMVVFG